jgi:glycosyltransferase involved in cell wall biosynthesis
VAHDQQHPDSQRKPVQGVASARPKVSVCLLTYNHAHIVEDTLQSVLQQSYVDFELIISDDCSTDGTYAALLAAAQTDPRLRVVQTPKNIGMAGNANFAVAQARGEYIALLHHDDIYSPQLIEAWASVLDRNPTAGFVSNSYRDHHTGRLYLHPFAERNHGRRILRRAMLPTWGCPVRGTAMIRKRCWDAVAGMREQFGMLADVDLWMRLAAKYDLGYVAQPLIMVRHDRPDYYPDAYWRWSWPRLKLTYAIYGAHHESFYGRASLGGRVQQAVYRARVNADILKWLGYGVVKRRRDILSSSDEVANAYEYWPVVAARKLLRRLSPAY